VSSDPAAVARPSEPAGLTLEQRVQRLEDIQQIQNLRSRYHTLIDDTEFDAVADLFTENAYVNLSYLMPQGQPWVGRDVIAASFGSMKTTTLQSQVKQFLHSHIVTITGQDTATGTALLLALYGVGPDSYVVAGKYTEEYERVDGNWLISRMVLSLYFSVPLTAGWAGLKRHYLVNSGAVIPDLTQYRPNPGL
jgi:ketosteroid isomerase-like protein